MYFWLLIGDSVIIGIFLCLALGCCLCDSCDCQTSYGSSASHPINNGYKSSYSNNNEYGSSYTTNYVSEDQKRINDAAEEEYQQRLNNDAQQRANEESARNWAQVQEENYQRCVAMNDELHAQRMANISNY